jgi:hypothetical protein
MVPHAHIRNDYAAVTLPPLHQRPYTSVRWANLTETPSDSLNVVEAELISVFAGCDNPKIVTQRIFLEEFLGEILQVSLRKRDAGSNRDFLVYLSSQRKCR